MMKDILNLPSGGLEEILSHLKSIDENTIYKLLIEAQCSFVEKRCCFNNFELGIYLQFYEIDRLDNLIKEYELDRQQLRDYDYLLEEKTYVMHDGINFLIVYYGDAFEALKKLNAEYIHYPKICEEKEEIPSISKSKIKVKPLKRNFYKFSKLLKNNNLN